MVLKVIGGGGDRYYKRPMAAGGEVTCTSRKWLQQMCNGRWRGSARKTPGE
jgi:hypothetical protein